LLGAISFAGAIYLLHPVQFNVVNYRTVSAPVSLYWPTLILPLLVGAGLVFMPLRRAPQLPSVAATLMPLVIVVPLVGYLLLAQSVSFATSLILIVAVGWTAFRVGANYPSPLLRAHPNYPSPFPRGRVGWGWGRLGFDRPGWASGLAVGSIVAAIVALTVVHTIIQINFFEHFMLGHADFGHYLEEFKNVLTGRGLRCDSFPHTRFGQHFVPLIFILLPGYMLWPSPVYLFVCGPLFVHLAALPIYTLARRRAESVSVAWMLAMAWLLLPSLGRLVYSGTYGFQWIYFAMPLMAGLIAADLSNRPRLAWTLAVLTLLCQETTAAATLGWGVYRAIFSKNRFSGFLLAAVSILYLLLCMKVIIPIFAVDPRYQRLDMYGALGGTPLQLLAAPFTDPAEFARRLFRWEAGYYLLTLLGGMAFLPFVGWRMTLAAVPALLTILLFDNPEWLSIKFWHHCTLLPILFMATWAIVDRTTATPIVPSRFVRFLAGCTPSPAGIHRGIALAVLSCSALAHYFYGFSPLSKSFEVYAADPSLHRPDPRMDLVRRLRAAIPRTSSIHATERLAAHFTDYQFLFTGVLDRSADVVIIDRADDWDPTGLPQQTARFAADPRYELWADSDGIAIFRRPVPTGPVRAK
jgi:uncharacterized membrane protein